MSSNFSKRRSGNNMPLHVSAGYNKVEIVKFLLDRQGTDKDELEAKNMYGESPLHIAAKNGCNDAAQLLLGHGAIIEAKANNGMTPLYLAVWYSLRAEDCSTVNTLLEYNADCSAKDNEGMTPLNHLSLGLGSEKLLELLNWHLEEQRKRRAIEACCETKAKMDELENEISNVVGLHELKVQLRKWARGMLLDERCRTPHMAFLGNPGSGSCWQVCLCLIMMFFYFPSTLKFLFLLQCYKLRQKHSKK
ncbi:serine/threonine-protein phosphatase 6 regulatory ankyrin repeat subunit A-like isoform X3 [Juglans microcarpa x Juglans regia]|uniref:serine/threonine-protein phosphatase 6 regulatory ankyrin repeat subunit A-like isoform X3 n=1 Tax=Juglans microcarpa x Juglans regia TaxID=2249226 RepID=UPI001B7E43A1|nr:serine/threonine-protein phosphatase 6 regulatory ankyrin repeat subunit A-like isoform X3 [Juglans microcarpa x Juglans regia]